MRMIKTNLPVLLIRNMVLFPHSEIRLEFENDNEKSLLSLAESYYNNTILVVNPKDNLEIDPDISELPKIGVVANIKMKIDMPNGKTRIILSGYKRVKVHTYNKEDNIYEAMTSELYKEELELKEELAYARSLMKHVEVYVREVPYMSNAVLSQTAGINDIDKLTDVVALYLPISFERKIEYLEEVSSTSRVKMILDDINRDIEILKLEKEIEEEVTKQLDESQKEFVLREKIRIIKEELGDINDKDSEVDSLREEINKLECSAKVRKRLINELNRYSSLNPNSPEIGIIRTYIDWLIKLPWNKFTKDNNDLEKVKDILDSSHYALDSVKERILEYLAVKQNTNNLSSPILCLVGPPGVGKTTLAKSIADSLKRKCTKISVGGVNDEAEIVGHRRTYIGAAPGLIIQGMKKVGTSNPVFIIDEIDKMTKDIKGDPASSLLEVLDKEQNKAFIDHYIEEEFDLSNVMFIATANYIDQIPEALKDRLEIIEVSSYTEYEKFDIAKNYLIKKLITEHGLEGDKVSFTDDAIFGIIRNYTKESGVRELDRTIATILRKIVKEKILSNKKKSYRISENDLEKYLGHKKYFYNENESSSHIGIVNGLAYTPYGGDILPIEVTSYPGKGELILTGSLGEVMRESARISLSYIKANSSNYNLEENYLDNIDIHIHVPEGAVPKEGPSAGVAITTALLSLFTNTLIDTEISMTGEMTLSGRVLPIGGVKEKLIGAHRANSRKVYLPKQNEKDVEDVPKEVIKDMNIIFVDNYIDIYGSIKGE